MSTVSEILKSRRKELGLTLAKIADYVGVSEATVQRWESGNIKNLRYERLIPLSEVLNVPPESLMGWKDINDKRTSAPTSLTEVECELLAAYRRADKSAKDIVNFVLGIKT